MTSSFYEVFDLLDRLKELPTDQGYEPANQLTIDALNSMNILPAKIGQPVEPGSPESPLTSINSIFDPELEKYIDGLDFEQKDAFYSYFTGEEFKLPEWNAKAGQDGGPFGLFKDIAGDGLGIVWDGLKVLDIASKYTEQTLGLAMSYVGDPKEGSPLAFAFDQLGIKQLGFNQFGADLSLGDRWRAGQLFYEGLGDGKEGDWQQSLHLAAMNDEGFNDFVKNNQGGWTDTALRFALDPLWLVGGVPIIPGLMKMTKVGALEKVGAGLARGVMLEDVPPLGKLFTTVRGLEGPFGTFARAVTKPLAMIGVNVENQVFRKAIEQSILDPDTAKYLAGNQQLLNTLNHVANPGLLKRLAAINPANKAERVTDDLLAVINSNMIHATDPAVFKAELKAWQKGEMLPNSILLQKNRNVGETYALLNKLDIDSFKSLDDVAVDWKQKFYHELTNGIGKTGTKRNDTALTTLAREMYGVTDNPGPIGRYQAAARWLLGFTLLNNPAYVMLNLTSNLFHVAFDALDAFNANPYGTLGVVGTKVDTGFRAATGFSPIGGYAAKWRNVLEKSDPGGVMRGLAKSGTEWMQAEYGLVQGQKHLWDNIAFNFGVRSAAAVDNFSRGMAADFAVLRSDHYIPRQVIGEAPEEIRDYIKGVNPIELAAKRGEISRGEATGFFSLRSLQQQYVDELAAAKGITDETAKLALRETLDIHLAGVAKPLEDEVLRLMPTGDRELMVDAIGKSNAEVQMYNQQANRMARQGVNSPPVEMKTIFDTPVRDYAITSDEMVMWQSQLGLILDSAGYMRLQPGNDLSRLTATFGDYSKIRQNALADYVQAKANDDVNEMKAALYDLADETKKFRNASKNIIDGVVNRLAKSDVNQARLFNDASKRFLDSWGVPEETFNSSLRSNYWPSFTTREEAFDNIQRAIDERATSVRDYFSSNVQDFKVGSFAPQPVIGEAPMLSDRFQRYAETYEGYTDYLTRNVDNLFENGRKFQREADINGILKFIDEGITPRLPDIEFAKTRFVRMMTDHSMLDYTSQRGIDSVIKMVYPYEFWPTRTAWHWAQRGLAKPGAVGALYHLQEFQETYQAEVEERYVKKVQERLDTENLTPEVRAELEQQLSDGNILAARMRKLVVPVPFLNDALKRFGLEGVFNPEIAFDPFAAMFPVLNWTKDFDDFADTPDNWLGKAYRAANVPGLSVSPIIKSAFSLSGVLPERDEAFDWIRNSGSPALQALGFGPVGKAAYRWWALGDDEGLSKVSEILGVDVEEFFFEHGYGPPAVLHYLASEITGTDPRDVKNFELYNTSRALASSVATDNRLLTLEDERKKRLAAGEDKTTVNNDINDRREAIAMEYVRAYQQNEVVTFEDGSRGPSVAEGDRDPVAQALWDKARKVAATESGLKEISRWLFGMGGINVWMPGEPIQSGIEMLQDAIYKVGTDDDKKAFFNQYPEFTSRKIQDLVLNDSVEAGLVARESLYFWESELIQKKYSSEIKELATTKKQISAKIDEVTARGLSLRANRSERGAWFDQLEKVSKQLSAVYDARTSDYDRITALYGKPRNSTAKNPWERALDDYADEWYAIERIRDEDEREAAEEAFLSAFPPAKGDNTSLAWLSYGARASALRQKAFDESFGKSNEESRKIEEDRDRQIEGMTTEISQFITRRDMEAKVGRLQQGPPSPQLAEYNLAKQAYSNYAAIGELGLSDDEERRRKKAYWDSQPLLEKYYGLESYLGSPDYAIQKTLQRWYEIWDAAPPDGTKERTDYLRTHDKEIDQLREVLGPSGLIKPQDPKSVRLGELWEGYFELPEDSQARRDYFAANKAEIDQLGTALNKAPSQGSIDVSRESQIWDHYYSLPKGKMRTAYLMLVEDELNAIRARLGKEPLTEVSFVFDRPQTSQSGPVEEQDLLKALGQ